MASFERDVCVFWHAYVSDIGIIEQAFYICHTLCPNRVELNVAVSWYQPFVKNPDIIDGALAWYFGDKMNYRPEKPVYLYVREKVCILRWWCHRFEPIERKVHRRHSKPIDNMLYCTIINSRTITFTYIHMETFHRRTCIVIPTLKRACRLFCHKMLMRIDTT